MRTEELRAKLQRVIAFPVTPFHPDLSPDIAGLRTNRRALLHHPMAAIVAAGGTGEMYSLTPPRIWKLYGLWWRGGGRIPVISGTGFNVAIGVDLARQSASMGAGMLSEL
jgi:5-dehydro-4-deoxyglucarate dehydratase